MRYRIGARVRLIETSSERLGNVEPSEKGKVFTIVYVSAPHKIYSLPKTNQDYGGGFWAVEEAMLELVSVADMDEAGVTL